MSIYNFILKKMQKLKDFEIAIIWVINEAELGIMTGNDDDTHGGGEKGDQELSKDIPEKAAEFVNITE